MLPELEQHLKQAMSLRSAVLKKSLPKHYEDLEPGIPFFDRVN